MASSEADRETLRWLAPIFTRRRPDGSLYFSDADVAAFLPVFALSLGIDPQQAPPFLLERIGALGAAAGVALDDPPPVRERKLKSYLEANPLNPELLFLVQRGLREEVATYSPEELVQGLALRLGLDRPALLARDPEAPAPAGSVRSGPMARFQLDPDPSPRPKSARRRR